MGSARPVDVSLHYVIDRNRFAAQGSAAGRLSMEAMIVPPEILDRFNGSLTLNVEVPVAPHAGGGIPEYRCKVYRSLLNLEMHRFSVARLKNDSLLFPKSSGNFA